MILYVNFLLQNVDSFILSSMYFEQQGHTLYMHFLEFFEKLLKRVASSFSLSGS